MKIAVVMNAGAGGLGAARTEARAHELRQLCADEGLEATVEVCEPARLVEAARAAAASSVDAVVAAGGDGTVSAVASALAGGPVPLAVIPLGTLNHFAKDLGMPIGDLREAVRAIASAQLRRIDVGDLGGRVFLNNASIGLYPEMVLERDADRRTTGRRKWAAMVRAAARVLRRFPLLEVRIATRQQVLVARTPFVFIGNNEYALSLLELGARPALDRGQLSLYMMRSTSRFRMFWLMVRAILHRLDAARDFEAHTMTEAVISIGKRRLEVAVDGEVIHVEPPLRVRIRPQVLRVLAPPLAALDLVPDRPRQEAPPRADARG